MNWKPHRMRTLAVIAAASGMLAQPVAAQSEAPYSNKPVRIVVAFAPGGFADGITRLVGQKLSERLGQPVVVENRGGAGGNIGARQVAGAAPDGYTLLAHTAASAINVSLYKNPGFDLLADLVPIANTGSTPGLFAVHVSNPANSLQDLIRLAKANGGRLTYSTAGVGTSSHLAAEYLFNTLAGLKATHVPYQGGAPAITAVVSNQVDVISGSMPPVAVFVKQGSLKALAISSLKRAEALPNVPTVTEAGFPDFEERSWVGFFAPAKTPSTIVNRLNEETNQILLVTDVKERLAAQGMEPQPGSAEAFADYIRKEVATWSKIVKTTGITAE
jgi:tripartite-type tricarboxylate transporter receptor subunit TctC